MWILTPRAISIQGTPKTGFSAYTQALRYPSASASERLARDAPLRALLSRLTLVKPTRLPLSHTCPINLRSTSQDDETGCVVPSHRILCEVYESFWPEVQLPLVLLWRVNVNRTIPFGSRCRREAIYHQPKPETTNNVLRNSNQTRGRVGRTTPVAIPALERDSYIPG